MLTEKDIEQIEKHGLNINQVYGHLEIFKRGIPFANIVTTASAGNGIQLLSSEEQKGLDAFYESNKDKLDIVKFVPASGAATRMFQFLHEFLDNYDPESRLFRDYVKNIPIQISSLFLILVPILPLSIWFEKKYGKIIPIIKNLLKDSAIITLPRPCWMKMGSTLTICQRD